MYEREHLSDEIDDGTMPENVKALEQAVVGHRITFVEKCIGGGYESLLITLDNGKQVELVESSDCCAFTELDSFLLHPERIDHIITGVGTTGGYSVWHIYADLGDVLELSVGWSPGNPFYYGYGFRIYVRDIPS